LQQSEQAQTTDNKIFEQYLGIDTESDATFTADAKTRESQLVRLSAMQEQFGNESQLSMMAI
jgi:hypothetical protein